MCEYCARISRAPAQFSRRRCSLRLRMSLVRAGFLRTESGVRAHEQFVELALGLRFVAQERADNRSKKTQRDAENPGILEREQRLGLNQVAGRARHRGRIDRHEAGADENQSDGSEQADAEYCARACCVKAPP